MRERERERLFQKNELTISKKEENKLEKIIKTKIL